MIVTLEDVEWWATTTGRSHFVTAMKKAHRLQKIKAVPLLDWKEGNRIEVGVKPASKPLRVRRAAP